MNSNPSFILALLLGRELERESERAISSLAGELLIIAECYRTWTKQENSFAGQNSFAAFCATHGYIPAMGVQKTYWAVAEILALSEGLAREWHEKNDDNPPTD